MQLKAQTEGHATTNTPPPISIFEVDPSRVAEIASSLETREYRLRRYGNVADALASLHENERPGLLILSCDPPGVSPSPSLELRIRAREYGIPILEIVETGCDPASALNSEVEAADWVFRQNLAVELPVRVERLLRRHGHQGTSHTRSSPASAMLSDPRLFPLIVHDLRTPLNVVGLSLRMIEQVLPKDNAEVQEDLRFVEEGFRQIERMLAYLSDYCRLFEPDVPVDLFEFSPERLIHEVVENSLFRAGAKPVPVRVEVRSSCPAEALLDQSRAKQAMQYALANAVAAAKVEGVQVTLHGGPTRWVTEFRVNHPPPPSVDSVELRPHLIERLCGTTAERRGMDLAIVARISELFGGGARLEADEMRGTTIILDWPVRSQGH